MFNKIFRKKFICCALTLSMVITPALSAYADNENNKESEEVVEEKVDSQVLASATLEGTIISSESTPAIMMLDADEDVPTTVDDSESQYARRITWTENEHADSGEVGFTDFYFYLLDENGNGTIVTSVPTVRTGTYYSKMEDNKVMKNQTINFVDNTSNNQFIDFRYAEIDGVKYELVYAKRHYQVLNGDPRLYSFCYQVGNGGETLGTVVYLDDKNERFTDNSRVNENLQNINLYYRPISNNRYSAGAKLVDYDADAMNAFENFGADKNVFKFINYSESSEQQWNQYIQNQIYQGIAASYLSDNVFKLNDSLITGKKVELFPEDYNTNKSAYPYVEKERCFKEVAVEFIYDERTKNYELDCNKYTYEYNYTTNSLDAHFKKQDDPYGFFPFGGETNENGTFEPDFHFGMYIPLSFSVDANANKKFMFSGDDDVFVYIDGKLVLDIGGIHNAIYGEIDFTSGNTYIQAVSDSGANSGNGSIYKNYGTGAGNLFTDYGFSRNSFYGTNHTLTIVYFERGAGNSNNYISTDIDIKETADVTINNLKQNEDDEALEGAEFTLYGSYDESSKTCSGEQAKGVTDKTGSVTFTGISAGSYYMMESKAPDNYVQPANGVWKLEVTIDSSGNYVTRLQALTDEAKALSKPSNDNVSRITNKRNVFSNKTKTVTVKKTWTGDSDNKDKRTDLAFKLYGYYTDSNGDKKYVSANGTGTDEKQIYRTLKLKATEFSSDSDVWEKTFDNIPIYFNNDPTKVITWDLEEVIPYGYEQLGSISKTVLDPIDNDIQIPESVPQSEVDNSHRHYTHVDIKTKAAVASENPISAEVEKIRDVNGVENQFTVVGSYSSYNKYDEGITFELVGQNGFEWSYAATAEKKGILLGENSIIAFQVKMKGSDEWYTAVIDKNSTYPAGTLLPHDTDGYEMVCYYLGEDISNEYVDISGESIFTISLLTCNAISVYKNAGHIGYRTINQQMFNGNPEYFNCGLDLVLSPEVIRSLNGTGNEIYEITNIYAGNRDFYNVDKTAESNGREATINLSAIKGTVVSQEKINENPADIVFVIDSSKSMAFPADLKAVDQNASLDTSKEYYFISDTAAATIYKVFYTQKEEKYYQYDENNKKVYSLDSDGKKVYSTKTLKKHKWYYMDSSAEKGYDTAFSEYTGGQQLFEATSDKTRIDYLMSQAQSLVNSLPVGSRISLVTFNEDSQVYNFASGEFDMGVDATVEKQGQSQQIVISSENKFAASKSSNYSIVLDGTNTPIVSVRDAIYKIKGNLASKTRQDNGLLTAKDVLNNCYFTNENGNDAATDSNGKYVIMFSDGCPNIMSNNARVTASNGTVYDAAQAAKNTASEIKALGDGSVSIITVGIDLDISSKLASAKELMKECASNNYFYSAMSNDLEVNFKSFITTITSGAAEYKYSKGIITDVIDSRFDLILDDGTRIVNNPENGVLDYNGENPTLVGDRWATISLENNLIKITWNGAKNTADEGKGETLGYGDFIPWSVSFKVVAKEDFLGGNMIQTNGPSSGVLPTDGEEKRFPRPSVNITPLKLSIESGEQTVYLGDKLSVYTAAKAYEYLLKTSTITNQFENKSFKLSDYVSVPYTEALDDNRFSVVEDGYIYTCDYSYGASSDKIGQLKFIFRKNEEPNYVEADGTTKLVKREVAKYTLEIVYTPDTVSQRGSTLKGMGYSAPSQADNLAYSETTETGTYINNVITSGLTLTKYGLTYDEADKGKPVSGASYGIYERTASENGSTVDTLKATGVSATNGRISFDTFSLEYGKTYIVKELAAPSGFAISNTEYSVVVNKKNDTTYTVVASDGQSSKTMDIPTSLDTDNTVLEVPEISNSLNLDVYDYILYTLPETGGSGIYLYTISGVLLILAATLLLYKRKNKSNK